MQNLSNHTILPFKLVHLKPDETEDENTLAHRHSYYELFIFEEEGKNHFIDFENYKVQQQSMHLVMPGSVHLLKRNKHTKGFVLLFSEEFYHLHIKNYDLWLEIIPLLIKNGATIELSKLDFKSVLELCHQIENYKDFKIISTYLHLIILIFQKAFNDKKTIPKDNLKLAYEFRKLVEIEYKENHSSAYYSNKLIVSSSLLNKTILNTYGKTPSEIIKERILLEAKRLLFYNEYSSKEIAYYLGFNDDSYFGKFFKNKIGISTSQFRQESRKKYK